MKLIDFNTAKREWDRFNAFHTSIARGKFIQFETGELMANTSRWKPHDRRIYGELNLEVITPRVSNYKYKLPDGRIVPRAWLIARGSPDLLVDLDTKRAVNLAYNMKADKERPRHLQNATAWFTGEGATLQGSRPITISAPREQSATEKLWIGELRKLCRVFYKVAHDGEGNNPYSAYGAYRYTANYRMERLIAFIEEGKTPSEAFNTMSVSEYVAIADNRITSMRTEFDVPYVEVI